MSLIKKTINILLFSAVISIEGAKDDVASIAELPQSCLLFQCKEYQKNDTDPQQAIEACCNNPKKTYS